MVLIGKPINTDYMSYLSRVRFRIGSALRLGLFVYIACRVI